MAIVEEYKIGNTTIKICDDAYKDKTPEQIEKVKERITSVCWEIARKLKEQGKDI